MNMDDDYFRFKVGNTERKEDNSFLSIIIKFLLVLVLLIGVIVLGIYAYKLLTKDETTMQVKKVPIVIKKAKNSNAIKKEELVIIIRSILEEMKKQQANNPQKIVNKSEDSELLQSLQNLDDEKKPQEIVKKEEIQKKKDIVAKEVKKPKKTKKPKFIKKEIVYNAVIIGNKEIKSTSDLAKLYASINRISKSKKRKILRSAYTKKIKKEIIIRKNSMRTIIVRAGDTLSSIAKRAYGKASMYRKIYDANPDLLANPHRLRVGMRLRVPK